jgi:hypothetical protein
MKSALKILLLVVLVLSLSTACADDHAVAQGPSYQRFLTVFGELALIDEAGKPSATAVDAVIGGKPLLSSREQLDAWASREVLMLPDGDGIELSKSFKPGADPLPVDRLVVQEGANGNCIDQFVILDFTGTKPFVSERFGYNPDGKACLKFIKAKWGKKESYIYLEGPLKYIYYTGGKVVGPL